MAGLEQPRLDIVHRTPEASVMRGCSVAAGQASAASQPIFAARAGKTQTDAPILKFCVPPLILSGGTSPNCPNAFLPPRTDGLPLLPL